MHAWQGLQELAASRSLATRIALVEAIERQPAPEFEGVLLELAQSLDERLAVHVARAMARVRSAAFLPTLVGWLCVRELREAAREALCELGEPALAALDEALFDPRTAPRVREHIPRTISLFPSQQAVAVLPAAPRGGARRVGSVSRSCAGWAGIASDHPEVALDDALVRELATRTVEAAIEVLGFRVGLEKGAEQLPAGPRPRTGCSLRCCATRRLTGSSGSSGCSSCASAARTCGRSTAGWGNATAACEPPAASCS